MDRDDVKSYLSVIGVTLLTAWVMFLSVCAAAKLGGKWFDMSQSVDLNVKSLQQCAAEHGTPILEQNGQAYKSCAINGKSDTRNIVK